MRHQRFVTPYVRCHKVTKRQAQATGGTKHYHSDCPAGAALAPGDTLAWFSDSSYQGSVGQYDNGCAAKDTCGLPYSRDGEALGGGPGGGWELCFAR